MKGFKKLLIAFLALIAISFMFLLWYQHQYSMAFVEPYAINSPLLEKKLLIATQGSRFKDEITTGIVNQYSSDSIYIKIIDISALKDIDPKDFNALVILHTWEKWQPPAPVKTFIDRTKIDKKRIVVLTTSGEGTYKMEEVDAITGASILQNAPAFTKTIISRLTPLLKAQ